MAKFGYQFSGTDPLKKADGRTHEAAVRTFKNFFDLSADGSTAQSLKIAGIGPGVNVETIVIRSDQNLSAINFTVGTLDTPAKYGASVAGPNAGALTIYPPIALALTCTAQAEDIYLFPSGNLPAIGSLLTRLHGSER